MARKSPIILLSILLLSFNLFAQTADEVGLCDNGIDDDQDGFVDCFDSDCHLDPTQCTDFFFGNDIVCNSITENPTFSLRVQWGSANRTAQNSATPAIGDIDGDGIPEVVVTNRESQELYVLDGTTGTTEGVVNVGFTVNRTAAIAKVDPTTPDCGWIFIQGSSSRNIKAYDCNLNQMWSVNGSHASDSPGLLGLADFDGDGNVELYHKNEIRNALTGALIVWGGGSWITGSAEGSSAADILPDGFCTNCDGLELADGSKIWSVDIATGTMDVEVDMDDVLATDPEAIALGLSASERKFKHKLRGNGSHQTTYVSLADYNQDGNIDVVTSGALGDSHTDEPVTIFFWDVINQDVDFYQDPTANLSFKNGTGRINVGDTDGDGQLNATYVSNQILYSLDENLDPIWTLGIKEGSSGFTGCTLFDFDGDGAAETVYRGEDFLFIIDGATTNPAERVRNTVVCVSRTYEDYPIVADVDGDGASEICVTCSFDDNQPFEPYSNSINGHVRIFESDGEQWLPSRPVWNQHGYFNTHVNDDLTIPIEQQSHTQVFNNQDCSGVPDNFQPLNVFLNQLPILDSEGCPNAVFPDLGLVDGSITITPPTCPENEFPVSFQVANEGDIPINGILPVSFYDGDPRVGSSTYLSTDFFTLTGIAVGQVVTVNTTATGTGTDFDLWVSVNDLGGVPPVTSFVGSIPGCTLGADLGNGLVDVGPFMIDAIFLTDDARCLPIIPPNGSMQAFFNGTLPASESLVWLEDFEDLTPTDISDNGATAWSRTTPSGNAEVLNQLGGNVFWFKNTQGEAVWTSQIIDISTFDFADLSLTFLSSSNLEGSDYLRAFYSVDGGTETLFTNNGDNSGSFFTALPTATVVGNSVQIIVRSSTSNTNEEHFIEDVQVLGGINAQTGQISSGFTFEWFLDGDFSTVVHTGDSITTATAGVYSVVGINDASGCQSDTLFNHVTIGTAMPTPVVSIVEVVPNTDCAIPNGLLRAAVIENGVEVTTGFDFEWTEATVTTVVISVGATADFLPGGSYAVTATSQSSGCASNTESATVLAPAPSVTLSAQVDQHVVDCVNPLSGEVSASASGTPTPAAEEIIWLEDFEDNTDNQESDNGATAWTRSPDNNGARVDDDDYSPDIKFRFSNTDETVTWSSQVIDISGFTDVNVSITLDERGNQDDSEILEATYILDGAPEVIFGMTQDDFINPLVVSSGNFTGTSLTILMRGFSNTTADDLYFDDVTVKGFTTVAPTFVFNWYVGQTTTALPDYNGATVTGLAPGFYTVEAEDVVSECVSPPITIEVLNNAGLPVLTPSALDNTGCTIGDGTAGAIVTNTVIGDDYTFEIFNGNNTLPAPIATIDFLNVAAADVSHTFTGLLGGFYTIQVSNTTQSCAATTLIEVADMPGSLTVVAADLTIGPNTSCNATDNGFIDATDIPNSGGDFTYEIWNGNSSVGPPNVPELTTADNPVAWTGLSDGMYTVVITDNTTGCNSGDVLVTVGLNPNDPDITEVVANNMSDEFCVNGNGQLSFTANSPAGEPAAGYTYTLFLGNNTNPINQVGVPVNELLGVTEVFFTDLVDGNYRVQVTNQTDGCQSVLDVVVADGSITPIAAAAKRENSSCAAPNGTLTGSVTNGPPDFPVDRVTGITFNWSIGGVAKATPDFVGITYAGLATGDYTLEAVQDATGCISAAVTFTINDVPDNPSITLVQVNPNMACGVGDNGTISASIDGNVSDLYTYEWFQGIGTGGASLETGNNVVTADITGLAGGDYTVEATGPFGCTSTESITLVDDIELPIITVITPSDNAGCTAMFTGTVLITEIEFDGNPVTIPDADYDFEWYMGDDITDPLIADTDEMINLLDGGDYTARVRKLSTGCISDPVTVTVNNVPVTITMTFAETTPNTVCDITTLNGPTVHDGVITATPSAGIGTDYTWQWFQGQNTNPGSEIPISVFGGAVVTDSVLTRVPAGTYTAEATSIATGCVSTAEYTLSDNLVDPVVSTAPADLVVTDLSVCSGGAVYPNGQIDGSSALPANVAGYDYTWYSGPSIDTDSVLTHALNIIDFKAGAGASGTIDIDLDDFADGRLIKNLVPGQYTVVVIDKDTGCESASATVTLGETQTLPVATLDGGNTNNNTVCALGAPGPLNNNGQITVTTTAVTPVYAWFVGQNTNLANDLTTIIPTAIDGGAVISQIPGGTYTLLHTDNSTGCSDTFEFTITDTTTDPVIGTAGGDRVDFDIVDVSVCGGVGAFPNGSVTLNTITGSGAYTFSWYYGTSVVPANLLDDSDDILTQKGTGTATPNVMGSATNAISNLDADQYTIQILDNNTGCTSAPVSFDVGALTILPTAALTGSNPNTVCDLGLPAGREYTGDIQVMAGGVGPWTYEWFVGQNTNPANGLSLAIPTSSGATTATISEIPGGTYTLFLTDTGTGCTDTFEFTIADNLVDPIIDISGGNGTDYNLTENTACLGANPYPNGGLALLDVTGSGAYTFEWYYGQGVSAPNLIVDGQNILIQKGTAVGGELGVVAGASTVNISNLDAGFYTVRVIDQATGCVSAPVELEVTDNLPPIVIMASVVQDDFSCNVATPTGEVIATVGGGTAGYTFQWFVGNNTAPANLLPAATGTAGAVGVNGIDGLPQGTYTIKAIDNTTLCFETNTVNIKRSVPTVDAMAMGDQSQNSCVPLDGEASSTPGITFSNGAPVGFVADFTYQWYDGQNTSTLLGGDVNHSIIMKTAGFFTVVVTETTSGCVSNSQTIEIQDGTEANRPTVAFTADVIPSSCAAVDGEISAAITVNPGGNSFTFEWYEGSDDYVNLFTTGSGNELNTGENLVAAPSPAVTVTVNPGAGVTGTAQLDDIVSGLYTLVMIDQVTGCRYQEVFDLGFIGIQATTTIAIDHVTGCPNNGQATVGLSDQVAITYTPVVGTFELFETITGAGGGTAFLNSDNPGVSMTASTTTGTLSNGEVITGSNSGATATINTYTNGFVDAQVDDISEYDIYLYSGTGVPADKFTPYEFPVGSGDFYPVIIDGTGLAAGSQVIFTDLPPGSYTAIAREHLNAAFNNPSAECFSLAATDEIEDRGYEPLDDGFTITDNTVCDFAFFGGNGSIEVNTRPDGNDTFEPGSFEFNWYAGGVVNPGSETLTDTDVTTSTLASLGPGQYTVQVDRLGLPFTTITHTGATGIFTVGETINFGGGGSAIVDNDDGTTLQVNSETGTLTGVITGATSGETANTNVVTPGGGTTNECTLVATYNVQDNPEVHDIISATINNIDNCNAVDGSVTIGDADITDLAADYSYEWFDAAVTTIGRDSTAVLANRAAGTYFVQGTHLTKGCVTSLFEVEILDITVDPTITLTVNTIDTSCETTDDIGNGIIDFDITNAAAGDYDFQWYTGSTATGGNEVTGAGIAGDFGTVSGPYTGSLSNVDGGLYTLEVFDRTDPDNGCTATATILLDEFTPVVTILDANVTIQDQDDCSPANGAATVVLVTETTSGGGSVNVAAANYDINWYEAPTGGALLLNGASLTGQVAGTYYVEATRTVSSCFMSNRKAVIIADQTVDPIVQFAVNNQDSFCGAATSGDGSITASVLINGVPAGAGAYSFTWYEGTGTAGPVLDARFVLTATTSGTNGQTADGLSDGIYTVEIIDNGPNIGCNTEATITLGQFTPDITIADADITIQDQDDCSPVNGSATVENVTETTDGGAPTVLPATNYNIEWFDVAVAGNSLGMTATLGGLAAGTYYVEATRQSTGCTMALRKEVVIEDITANPIIVFTVTQEDSFCDPGNIGDGIIEVGVRETPGGPVVTANYSFTWFRGQNTTAPADALNTAIVAGDFLSASGLSDGFYTVEVIDLRNPNNTCQSVASVEVIDESKEVTIFVDGSGTDDISTADNTNCTNPFTGSIQILSVREDGVQVTVREGNYTFAWATAGGGELPAGATLLGVNGTADLLQNIPGGTYEVLAINNGTMCATTIAIQINEVEDLTINPDIAMSSTPNNICDNGLPAYANGTITATATLGGNGFAGTGRWDFEWFDGSSTGAAALGAGVPGPDDTISMLQDEEPGFYTVRVTDQMTRCTFSRTFSIDEVLDIPVLDNPETNITGFTACAGGIDDGSISLFDVDITANDLGLYEFEWIRGVATNPPFAVDIIPGTVSITQSGLTAGTYYVIATNTATGCQATAARFDVPDLSFDPILSFNQLSPNIGCGAETPNGSLESLADGVDHTDPDYTFQWYVGVGTGGAMVSNPDGGNTNTIINQTQGFYTLEVMRVSTACTATQSFEIENEQFLPFVSAATVTPQVLCDINADGSVEITEVTYNGTTPLLMDFNYTWYDDLALTSIVGGNSPILSDQEDGTYWVVVAHIPTGCVASLPAEFEILDNIVLPFVTIDLVKVDESCDGINGDGSLQARSGGLTEFGGAMLSFQWYRGQIVGVNPLNNTSLQSNLLADFYTVEVTDNNTGCISSQTFELDNEPVEPFILEFDVESSDICAPGDGRAEVTVITPATIPGDVSEYTFFWFDDPAQFDPPTFSPIQSGPSPVLADLAAGSYYVFAELTATGCRTVLPTQIDVIDSSFFRSPIAITQTAVTLQTNCDPTLANGSISVAANGIADILQFTYIWRDENGVVIEANNPSVGGLAAGVYTVDVTSLSTGCSNQRIFTMIDDNETLLLRTSVSANTHCVNTQFNVGPNGRVAATIINGSSIYDFFWFSGTTVPSSFASFATDPNLVGNEQFLGSLASGTYTVIAVDQVDNFCVTAPQTVVVPDESEEPPLTITQVAPLTNCDPLRPNGEARVDSPGNNLAVYHIEWYVGTDTNVQPFQSGFGVTEADSLSAITYTVVLIDIVQGCQSTVEITIEDAPAPVPVPELSEELVHRIDCVEPNGEAEVTIAGGPENFRLEWFLENDLNTPFFVGTGRDDLAAGTYLVVAENLTTGCRSAGLTFVILDESRAPVFTVTTTPSVCSLDNGGASLSFKQIVNIDSIVWDLGNGDLRYDFQLANVTDGTGYRVFVRDENQCEFETTFNITTDIIVYNGVSDNADGMNDWFIIDCIDRFARATVKIFNRAGQLVWETNDNGYINGDDENSFRGIANKGLSFGSERLPEGTYFYIIDRDRFIGEDDIVQGFLELVR